MRSMESILENQERFVGAEAEPESSWLTLRFTNHELETQYGLYFAKRMKAQGRSVWLIRGWLVAARAASDACFGGGMTRMGLELLFLVGVLLIFAVSRSNTARFGEGGARWTALVLLLAALNAVSSVMSYTEAEEENDRDWTRYFLLGLDFAVDTTLFALLFGLQLPGVAAALVIFLVALIACFYIDAPAGAAGKGAALLNATALVVALASLARTRESAERSMFVRSHRRETRNSIDVRGLQNPFSTKNLTAWLSRNLQRKGSRTGETEEDYSVDIYSMPRDDPIDGDPELVYGGDDGDGDDTRDERRGERGEEAGCEDESNHSFAPSCAGEEKTSVQSQSAMRRRSLSDEEEREDVEAASTTRFNALERWELDYERLRVVEKVGAGSAGHVYKGEYLGATVAIKQLYSSFIDPHDLAEFSREVTLLHRLKHPHVLTFYGISRREMYCFIVTEFCPYALDAVLAGHRRTASGEIVAQPRLTVARRARIAYEVALALDYLHAERVLHLDLKPGNILLDHDFGVRVSDFGLSQLVSRESTSNAEQNVSAAYVDAPLGGTALFSAPEIIEATEQVRGFESLSKLDVYAFGILTAATFVPNGDPYHFYHSDARTAGNLAALEQEIVNAVAKEGLRPRVPAAMPEQLRPIMRRCWHHDPAQRPHFKRIVLNYRKALIDLKIVTETTSASLPLGPEASSS